MKPTLFVFPIAIAVLAVLTRAAEHDAENETLAKDWLKYMQGKWEVSIYDPPKTLAPSVAMPKHQAMAKLTGNLLVIEFSPAIPALWRPLLGNSPKSEENEEPFSVAFVHWNMKMSTLDWYVFFAQDAAQIMPLVNSGKGFHGSLVGCRENPDMSIRRV